LLGVRKPDDRFYATLFDRAGVDGSSAIVVDDNTRCLARAARLGAFTVLIAPDGGPSPAGVDATLPSLIALAEALR